VTTDERREQFRAVYEENRPRVIAYALRRTRSPEDAADIVAETFTIAWRRLEDVPRGEVAILWLYATARRVLANHGRRVRRRNELVGRIGAELAAGLARVEPPDEESVVARAALSRLGEDDRELLMLVGWEGLGAAQLACVLGCSEVAARIRLHRARSRLATAMHELGLVEKQWTRSGHTPLRQPVPAHPDRRGR
jgi:RNA polymerase sigma factor (sigma-70 family)